VWTYGVARETGHAAEKPVPLLRRLIQQFSDAGDLVLDPFAGSGSTLRAARDVGRAALGVEVEERWCRVAAGRMVQAPLPFVVAAE
jgi:site-specific DNA-methyltransferase (adenine-specific)